MKAIEALHLFNYYLPPTEHWAYLQIKNIPDTSIHIAAQAYLANDFYADDFHFVHDYKNPPSRIQLLLSKGRPDFLGGQHRSIVKYALSHQIDIVHAHFGKVAWHFRDIPKQLKVPFVVSFYGYDYEKIPFLDPSYNDKYKQLFAQADCFLCEGEHGAELLKQKGCAPNKIKVNHLGIEVNKIPFHQRKKSRGQLRLLQLASFTAKKGQLATLAAFAEARKNCSEMQLTFVGPAKDPGLKEKVISQINELGLNSCVKIIDQIDYAQLHTFMANFDVLIHPSQYTEEMDCEGGAPIVLLDAQATGMPVISTRHCDIPDEVIHGKTGLLATEKNVDQLSQAIIQFYQMDQEEYGKYSHHAAEHVKENYNVRQTGINLQAIYQALLNH